MDLIGGIDVHKVSVMVAVSDGRAVVEVPRTTAALARLARHLATAGVRGVVLEPSGGYERAVCTAMEQQGVPVMRIHPHQARAFAVAQGLRAKDDPIDARMLAAFGQRMAPRRLVAPSPALRHLQDLVAKRHHYVEERKRHQTWLTTPGLPITARDRRHLVNLGRIVDQIDQEITAWIAAHDELAIAHRRLDSMPAIGAATATLLLARLPELGHASAKQIAALVGVAPYQHRSGQRRGTAATAGGRADLRQGLWMPTMVALRHNPAIRTFRERLQANGKPGAVIMIACMHKLLTILNTMMRTGQDWSPHPGRTP